MVLYRKFRPTNFASVKEQTIITDILRSAIIHKKIAHAYLFTGTRGTGKTTTARIFAKAINCLQPKDGEPCNTCVVCLSFDEGRNVDLIEIDAASNRGIDDIREIREKVSFAPTMSTYKVYIIDEVHMLTKDAFNALLKTLEEPPEHAVFILATTETHKVPLTIISRCQKFDFKNASNDELMALLTDVCKKESLDIDTEALALVASLAEGSFRDSLSILEKLHASTDAITYQKALTILGIPDEKYLTALLTHAQEGDIQKAMEDIHEALSHGVDIYQLNKNMLKYLENTLLAVTKTKKKDLSMDVCMASIKEFLKIEEGLKYSAVPKIVFEAGVVSLCQHFGNIEKGVYHEIVPKKTLTIQHPPKEIGVKTISSAHLQETAGEKKIIDEETVEKIPQQKQIEEKKLVERVKLEAISAEDIKTTPSVDSANGEGIPIASIEQKWNQIILKVMPFNHHLGSFLAKAKPVGIEGSAVLIEVKYAFHKDRIEDIKSREEFARVMQEMFGMKLMPKCIVNAKLQITHAKTFGNERTAGFEKKQEISDNEKENIPSVDVSETDILEEAMKIFEME